MSKQITYDQRWGFVKIFGDWLGDDVTQAQASRIEENPDLLTRALEVVFHPPKEQENTGLAKWIEQILEAERNAHQNFFGKTFNLTFFGENLKKLGKRKVVAWKKLGMEIHYLPAFVFTQDMLLPGWKIKPAQWFWEQLAAGKLLIRNEMDKLVIMTEARFSDEIVLIDTRRKPAYDNGQQMWADDEKFLAPILECLRNEQKIANYDPPSSRFDVSSRELDDRILPAVHEMLGVSAQLETTIMGNVIPQLYPKMPRCNDGATNTWEWRAEFFGDASYRLGGGDSDFGGLVAVGYGDVGSHWHDRSFRPLGVVS